MKKDYICYTVVIALTYIIYSTHEKNVILEEKIHEIQIANDNCDNLLTDFMLNHEQTKVPETEYNQTEGKRNHQRGFSFDAYKGFRNN